MARKPDDQKKPKALDIDLQYKRLGYLGLKNIRKTIDITKGIKLSDSKYSKSPYKTYLIIKPLKYIQRVTTKRAFKPFNKIYINTFIINPIGYNNYKYGLILIDESIYIRQVYLFKEKNEALIYLNQFIPLVKTQYEFKIKAFRLDSRKEYSLTQFQALYNNIGAILEIITPYSAN